MVASIKDVDEGTAISFRSKNATDTKVWQGTLESHGTYRAMRPYGDQKSYNEAVRQQDPTVPSDLTVLNYFLITLNNQPGDNMTVFADEWIEPGSLNIISAGRKITVVVDDPHNNTQGVVSLLASGGYACKVLSES